MPETWILVANASHAKIYASKKAGHDIKLLQELTHSQSREKREDLLTDRPGRWQGATGTGMLGEPTDPKEVEANKFALQLVTLLHEQHAKKAFQSLIIVASPHFHGILNQHLDHHPHQLAEAVSHHIEKDYTTLPPAELNAHLLEVVRKHW